MKIIKFIALQIPNGLIAIGISTTLYLSHLIDSVEMVYIATVIAYVTLFVATSINCHVNNKKVLENELSMEYNKQAYSDLIDENNGLILIIAGLHNDISNKDELYNRLYITRVELEDELEELKERDNNTIEPFSEPIHQCKSCGSDDTRETPCYWICNVCKSREKKKEVK